MKILEAVASRHLAHETEKWTDGSYGDIKYMLIDRRKLVSDTELLIVYKKDGEITMDIETLKRVNE